MIKEEWKKLVIEALKEDIGPGDFTAMACIPAEATNQAQIIAKEEGIIAGLALVLAVFDSLDPQVKIDFKVKDGDWVSKGQQICTLSGSARSILSGERTALNFLQRLSGIATISHKISRLIAPYGCKVLDTRKTTPAWRTLEKWAVKTGGGSNHRMGLFDMMMIKENHIDFAGGIKAAIEKANQFKIENKLDLAIEIEARDLKELDEILAIGGVQRIMLDNFSIDDLKTAVAKINKRYETEASGGITLQNIETYAQTGVDYISVGALTHSVKSLDLSLLIL